MSIYPMTRVKVYSYCHKKLFIGQKMTEKFKTRVKFVRKKNFFKLEGTFRLIEQSYM
jgi:hypothetical protein